MVTLIYLRHGALLSTRSYGDWRELQDQFFDYRTSLGPWSLDDLFEFLDAEYSRHTFVRSEVEAFVESGAELMSGDMS